MLWRNLDKNQKIFAITIIILYLVTRLLPAIYLPLIQDESLYSVMIEEQVQHPTLIPTFLGEFVSWKPSLFFWIYGAMSRIQIINMEFTYRLPSIIFGLLSLIPLYRFLKKIEKNEEIVLLTIFIFVLSLPSIYSNSTVLLDSLNFLFIITAVDIYTDQTEDNKNKLIIGTTLTILAFFTKYIVSLTIPLVVLPYYYFYNRKDFTKKKIMSLLLPIVFSVVINQIILHNANLDTQLYQSITAHITDGSNESSASTIISSFYFLFIGFGVWFALSLIGLYRQWTKIPLMVIWFLPAVLATISAGSMPWYYLPFMPAVSYFAAICIIRPDGKKETFDIFSVFFVACLSLILIVNLYILAFQPYQYYLNQKNAGLELADKENVLVVGNYAPGIISYKVLEDIRHHSKNSDFGWIIFSDSKEYENKYIKFITNYTASEIGIYEGFGEMFSHSGVYRKNTTIKKFEYITVVGNYSIANQTQIYNSTGINIYRVR